jgi:hypothetical protein
MSNIPAEAQKMLNEIARSHEKPKDAKRVFIVCPNMNQLNVGLVAKLFAFAMQRQYDPWFHFLTEKRHADYARNLAAKAFLESKCDVCLMIDHDVDPHKDLLSLIDDDRDIASGNVFCWMSGELMASIWQRAECEQCRCLRIFQEKGEIHDPTQYVKRGEDLYRFDPFHGIYVLFANKDGILNNQQCRCKGTGFDPFVFRTHQNLTETPIKVDSVGSAALFISRRVFEKMPFPWFRFLYRESGEILVTEDHYFCWKAQEMGFEVWAYPKMFCSHYKTVDLLQLTGVINRAYIRGKEDMKLKDAVIIPDEEGK